jgi:alkanesulfonate monooxygenase SsuD/methylene tetrahydromethanopterin reductase-like flavin-dependent oxidoreductase (luciferase family)
MRFGMHFFLPCSDPQSPEQLYRDAIEQAVLAETLGFESVWPVEQHFNREVSVLSCPLLLLAAIAERTQRLRLGTAIVQLPLMHPLRVAEELATLDVLSRGRAELGVGRGTNPLHFAAFGAPQAHNRERMAEGLELIRRAWSAPRFAFDGAFYRVPEVALSPLPVQRPHPPIRVAANSADTARWAGGAGYPVILASNVNPLPQLPPLLAAYREGRAAAGLPAPQPDDLSLVMPVYVAESRAAARSELEPSILHQAELTRRIGEVVLPRLPPEQRATLGALIERMSALTYEHVEETMGSIGTPDACSARLAQLRGDHGIGRVIAWFNFGGMVSHEAVTRSMRLFARAVLPELGGLHDEPAQ